MVGNIKSSETVLIASVIQTLEEMSFSEADLHQEEVIFPDTSWFQATISVSQPYSGSLGLAVPRDLALQLAEATYGFMEGDLTDEMVLDTLGEFCNTIAGCALAKLLPGSESFMLDIPKRSVQSQSKIEGLANNLYFAVDGKFFALYFDGDLFK